MTNRLFATSYLQLTPIKGLTLKTLFNVDYQQQHEGLYRDYQSVSELQSAKGSYISNDQNHYINYTWDNTLNYITDFGGSDHSLTLLLGSSTKRNEARSSQVSGYASAEHYYKSSFYDVSLIKTPVNTSSYTKTTMQSYFGRVNYSYKSKYLLAASLRADGSSVLAKGHKWGYFPSVAVAWRVSDENFMESTRDWLDNLKLRASWGSTGNAGISAYQTLPMVNADNQITADIGKSANGAVKYFSRNGMADVYLDGNIIKRGIVEILNIKDIKIPGMHNVENYMAAIAAVSGLVSKEVIVNVAKTFGGVEHRIELVRTLDGVKYYNSSIDSSPNRTINTLRVFPNKVIMIAGGKDKGIPYDEIGPALAEHVKVLILIGATSDKIQEALDAEINKTGNGKDIEVIRATSYENAVNTARSKAHDGDVVLLSPASTSFDMFRNFEERGNLFKKIVNELN